MFVLDAQVIISLNRMAMAASAEMHTLSCGDVTQLEEVLARFGVGSLVGSLVRWSVGRLASWLISSLVKQLLG